MRARLTIFLLPVMILWGRGWAEEKAAPTSKDSVFSLTPVESPPGASLFSDAQLAYVQSWIKQKAPECPPAASAAVAEQFLEELQQRSPGKIEQLLSPEFPSGAFESMLLREVAVKLTGAAQGPLREELARRRVGASLAASGREPGTALADAAGLVAKIKDASPTQYRRLLEGKMDDDDLELQLKKINQPATAPKEPVPAKPKVLTVADIVSEFSRRNQVGSALQRLQAYTVEGKLKPAAGGEQELLLFKMRPDRFRLVVRSGDLTRYILSGDGSHFWQQTPGQPTQIVQPHDLGQRLYLAEFVDPLFVGEGFSYERREDGGAEGKKFYRIAVRRPDGSGYVACVDMESFRESARENDDHSVARYSDFREVAGVTYAFREEVTDTAGHKGVFEVTRIAPNPGLIQDFFELPAQQNRSYFEVERLLATAPVITGKRKP